VRQKIFFFTPSLHGGGAERVFSIWFPAVAVQAGEGTERQPYSERKVPVYSDGNFRPRQPNHTIDPERAVKAILRSQGVAEL